MKTAVKPNLHSLTRAQIVDLLAGWGYSTFHAARVWEMLYTHRPRTELRADLQADLAARTIAPMPIADVSLVSNDGFTRKYLLRLADGETIETVLMYFKGRATACVSSQVGCAMGCVFCATGQMGFNRHLSAGEIVTQVLFVDEILRQEGSQLRNVVFMGMGEPLHNYDATLTAVSILTDQKGLSLAPKHITISTVGIVPAIRRLADDPQPVMLAISLHGATDAERQALVPPAKRWPLDELIAACHYYIEKRRRRIFFEWALIAGENDTPEQAHALGELLAGMDAHVNLIPLNPTQGYDGQPTDKTAVSQFQSILAQYNLPSTVRQRRGIDIAAGCGQLKAASEQAGK